MSESEEYEGTLKERDVPRSPTLIMCEAILEAMREAGLLELFGISEDLYKPNQEPKEES